MSPDTVYLRKTINHYKKLLGDLGVRIREHYFPKSVHTSKVGCVDSTADQRKTLRGLIHQDLGKQVS